MGKGDVIFKVKNCIILCVFLFKLDGTPIKTFLFNRKT